MHICFITNKYPNPIEPNVTVFLQQLVVTIAKKGIKCSVISPVPTNLNSKYKEFPFKRTDTFDGTDIDVYFPHYFGLGQRDIAFFNPAKITTHYFSSAVKSVIKSMPNTPDYFYAHFVTPAGITAARMGRVYNKPAFLAYGEATLNTINHYGKKAVANELKTLNGVIAVSSQNKQMIEPFVPHKITQVFPNAIDGSVFIPKDKNKCQKKLGISNNKFVISFVGSFDERKGINRLCEAVRLLNDDSISIICAGKGSLSPTVENCIFAKPVLHEDLPDFLSASDIFVLPTQNEGCCNAIIEAMACGLPIISSDLSFNDEILDSTNSLRIDPNDVGAIAHAIKTLKDNSELRKQLSIGSLEKAKHLTLDKRADNIVNFMEKMS